eukprot:11182818-Lingulodinium_polyedra.AAC.1
MAKARFGSVASWWNVSVAIISSFGEGPAAFGQPWARSGSSSTPSGRFPLFGWLHLGAFLLCLRAPGQYLRRAAVCVQS